MRKVHLISVTEPLVLDLALALREKGYEVSASGCGLTEEMIGRLHNAGCTCYGDGWFPEKLIKDIHSVVLGAKVKQDNPELLRAKESNPFRNLYFNGLGRKLGLLWRVVVERRQLFP